MLHHLQVLKNTFKWKWVGTYISAHNFKHIHISSLSLFPSHFPPPPPPCPYSIPSSFLSFCEKFTCLSGRAQRRGDNVKYRNKLWSLIEVAVKKFWCPKEKGKNLHWLQLAEPSWFQGWVSHVKPRVELCSKNHKRPFLPSIFSFASCAKLQLSRNFM